MDEYETFDTIKLIQSMNLHDRCKCDDCQKEVKKLRDILDQRHLKDKKDQIEIR